ncbi:Nif3-like dinuclear metal center hexameric protein [Flavobacteriaceae bacterium M23B6Z8]
MKVQEVIEIIEELSPLAYAEDFDNVGLLVGDRNQSVSGILVTLDTLENVVDEAITKKCNMIVSFHPIIFSGIKKLTGKNYVERVVIKAIKHEVAIFSMHTALDNSFNGVNARICEILGLGNRSVLMPQKETIKKLQTYVPEANAAALREALFRVGAGNIGNYENCSFNTAGTGTFKGNASSNPVVGKRGVTQYEKEVQLSLTFSKHLEKSVLRALFKNHPYEEVAYEITTLENLDQHRGMGMVGELGNEMDEKSFLKLLKNKMNASCIRHSAFTGKNVRKVAVLGGSGAFAIEAAKYSGAQVFVTADVKYHEFYKAEGAILIADIGHYETEQFTKNLLVEHLKEKIHNFAVILAESITNPIKYF